MAAGLSSETVHSFESSTSPPQKIPTRPGTDRTPKRRLRVLICGAGLGGLGAAVALSRHGHEVTVLEGAARLSEIGAGIQIPPNSSRILKTYGLTDKIKAQVASPRSIVIKRYNTGDVLGKTRLHPYLTETYGSPYWLIHRADYQRILYDAALEHGAKIILSARVAHVNPEKPSVTTAQGLEFEADVVIGADGIRSRVRDCIFPFAGYTPSNTANCAYRATVTAEDMDEDPQIAKLLLDPSANAWIGPGRHVMAYPIRQGAMYNLVMCHPGEAPLGTWSVPGNVEEMREMYDDFDPVVRKIISKVTSCLKWTLADLPPLKSWLSKTGKVVLIGDAAHATVPFLAQGASMSIEDGACLAECLSRVKELVDVPHYLAVFERLRKQRCEKIQAGSRANGIVWHMPDGPDQKGRDCALQAHEQATNNNGTLHESSAKNPNPWSDEDFQPWLFGYDVFEEANTALDTLEGNEFSASAPY